MPPMRIRDVSLFVEVMGRGDPLLVMHGGPGADHWTMAPFRRLADAFTVILYDHRCNGRSDGAPVESMTWDNLTADADALREHLGFERWAVLGHSFGGHVALEYALRYPDRLSHLVLLDTGADSHWARENAPLVAAQRGHSPETVALIRRWFTGDFEPREMGSIFRRIGDVYSSQPGVLQLIRAALAGAWRTRLQGEPLVFAGRVLCAGWSVAARLSEISVPALVMAGEDDFVFPPECQLELASALPYGRLRLIERAGHNPHWERTAEVMDAVRSFLAARPAMAATALARSSHR